MCFNIEIANIHKRLALGPYQCKIEITIKKHSFNFYNQNQLGPSSLKLHKIEVLFPNTKLIFIIDVARFDNEVGNV